MATSWVIIEKATGCAVMETYNQKTVNAVNRNKFEVIPILEYLCNFNAKVKANNHIIIA